MTIMRRVWIRVQGLPNLFDDAAAAGIDEIHVSAAFDVAIRAYLGHDTVHLLGEALDLHTFGHALADFDHGPPRLAARRDNAFVRDVLSDHVALLRRELHFFP